MSTFREHFSICIGGRANFTRLQYRRWRSLRENGIDALQQDSSVTVRRGRYHRIVRPDFASITIGKSSTIGNNAGIGRSQ